MKKIIRWLSDISGVTELIKTETRLDIAESLPAHYLKKKPDAHNAFVLLRYELRGGVTASDIGQMGSRIRSRLTAADGALIIDVENQLLTKRPK